MALILNASLSKFKPLSFICSLLVLSTASSVVSSRGPTNATKEHEKRILESILPPDLRHLVRGGSPGTIQASFHNLVTLNEKSPS